MITRYDVTFYISTPGNLSRVLCSYCRLCTRPSCQCGAEVVENVQLDQDWKRPHDALVICHNAAILIVGWISK